MRFLRAFTCLVGVGLCAAALVAMLPFWPLELFDHFRVQYVAIGLAATAGAFRLGIAGYADATAIATLVHLCSMLSGAPGATLPERGTPVRILLLNVHTASTGYADVRDLITDVDPDIVALVEVNERWLDELAPALTGFAARIEGPQSDNFGVALYARGTITGKIEALGSQLPSLVAEVSIGPAVMNVILTHPLPPISSSAATQLVEQLDVIARRARTVPHALVMGDFNATPWSRAFRRLLAGSELCDSRDGHGLQPTFPAGLWPLRIPIDHLLHDCGIGVTGRRVERDVGSDHLPVVIDLLVP